MKRQNVRKALILISLMLFPATIYYFSPALCIMGASEGIVSGSLLVFGLQLVGALMFGRLFCGWVCPAGGLGEAMMLAQDRRATGGKWNWLKYIIWAPWVSMIAMAAASAGGLRSVDVFLETDGGRSMSDVGSYVIFYSVTGLIVVLSLAVGRRAFCHYVCWMAPFMVIGTKLGNLARLPRLRLTAETDKCIHCARCTGECPMSLEVERMVAQPTMAESECVLCGTCADVCPKGVIHYTMKPGA